MPVKKQTNTFKPKLKSVKSPSKRRIIVGLFVIAVLGGIALVLKSFAATSYTLVSTVDAKTLNTWNYSGRFCKYASTYDNGCKFNVAVLSCENNQTFDFQFDLPK